MPNRPARTCATPACRGIAKSGARWCEPCQQRRAESGADQPRRRPRYSKAQQRQYDQQRGSAAKRGYGPSWRKIRASHLSIEPTCRRCGKPGKHVDHITPKRRGGTNDPGNLQTLCAACHGAKTAAGE